MKSNLDTAYSHAFAASNNALFVVPSGRGDGFRATIRGHVLELADPDSGHALAPTPDDLLIVSIASDFAWSAQRFLRARRLPDYVSVSGAWRTRKDPPHLEDIDVTVTVSKSAEEMSEALVADLENSFAARSLNAPLRVRIRAEYGEAGMRRRTAGAPGHELQVTDEEAEKPRGRPVARRGRRTCTSS